MVKCGADKRRRRRLDGADPPSAPLGADANKSYRPDQNCPFYFKTGGSIFLLHILLSEVKAIAKGVIFMERHELVKQTLDQIPNANPNAKQIVGLVKDDGRVTGYQLSDNTFVKKQQAVDMAKQGQIAGVGIAHRGNTEYLKSIPDRSENNNLGNLPSVSPES